MAQNFNRAVQAFAEQFGWNIVELTDDRAIIEFENEDGYPLTLYLTHEADELIFNIPSIVSFEQPEDVPDTVSTFLLKRNIHVKTGFWALKELEDGWSYLIYHDQVLPNEDLELDLSAKVFYQIVQSLIHEVEEFDEWWERENW